MSAQLPDRRPARVSVTLNDGTTLTAGTETNRGDWADPYPPEEIRTKYLSLTARLWPEPAAAEVWDAVMGLEPETDMRALARLMRRAAT